MADYFTSRVVPTSIRDGADYWASAFDRDVPIKGRIRDRQQYLDDIKPELSYLNALPPGRILDIGCGLGFLLSGIDSRWQRHGVEASTFAANQARQWGDIHVGDLREAGYENDFFDAITIHYVIEHIKDPIALIVDILRILKPDGRLVLSTPDFDSGCARRFGANYRFLQDEHVVSMFTNESMHRFLNDHGFVIEKVEYPFFESTAFTPENLMGLFDVQSVSPIFYGDAMTFYCRKPMRSLFQQNLLQLGQIAVAASSSLDEPVRQAAEMVGKSLAAGNKVLVCGNGGSAADTQHFVAELIGHMSRPRRSLPAISLTTDPSIMTALANDYGYANVFARQIEGLGEPGDVLIAISTSGRSANVLAAMHAAIQKGLHTIVLLGEHCPDELTIADVRINVPSSNGQRVQEIHTAILHVICASVEEHLGL